MNARAGTRIILTAIFPALLGLAGGTPAIAAGGHDHGSAAARLTLDAGSRWQTDAALRQGMLGIRAAVEASLPAVHAGTFSPGQYQALGEVVDKEIAAIVQNCRLAPEADAVLHGVIAEMADGADVVTGRKAVASRDAGVVHLVNALGNYGRYFDHPGWSPVAGAH